MLIFVGLGNPGKQYQFTLHNLGFLFLDNLQDSLLAHSLSFDSQVKKHWFNDKKKYSLTWSYSDQLLGEWLLAKPQTFMNESGRAVFKLVKWFGMSDCNIKNSQESSFQQLAVNSVCRLIVVYDDLDIQWGRYKLQFNKSPKVHNGVNSIKKDLPEHRFWHLRIGIANATWSHLDSKKDYLLQSLSADKLAEFNSLAQLIIKTHFIH